MRSIRKRLTYANVMSSIAVFVVLGGAAFAATKLPKKSVGTAQLKANAVTTAKIKKNAVTSKKIKDGTVNVKDVNVGSMPFGRVVAKLRTTGPQNLLEGELQNYPLSPSTYSQAAEENDNFLGALDVTFQSTCEPPRAAIAIATLDAPVLATATEEQIIGLGVVEDKTAGTVSRRVQINPFAFVGGAGRFEPGATTNHSINVFAADFCENGSGVTANSAGMDVIGTK
jgi:hypothetical protein